MDNDWDDPAVVGAHAYAGWFYDYFAKRHGWEGVDGSNMRSILMVNDEIANAFFWYPPFGPEGTGAFSFGNYMGEPFTWLDIVGHELMHAVTHFSVSERTGNPDGLFNVAFPIGWRLGPKGFTTRGGTTYTCSTARFPGWVVTPDGRLEKGLVQAMCIDGRFVLGYAGAGAIHEGYSDIFGESLGFFYRDQGVSADYEYLGDAEFGPVRFLNDPKQRMDPDHYRDRYEFAVTVSGGYWDYSEFAFIDGRFVGSTGEHSYGGDHWNSLILSHAYYLAVEGGTHGSSGVVVDGVGDSNRAEMERMFFRAMRDLMPSMATLPMAAAIIRQSAADLAPGSAARTRDRPGSARRRPVAGAIGTVAAPMGIIGEPVIQDAVSRSEPESEPEPQQARVHDLERLARTDRCVAAVCRRTTRKRSARITAQRTAPRAR